MIQTGDVLPLTQDEQALQVERVRYVTTYFEASANGSWVQLLGADPTRVYIDAWCNSTGPTLLLADAQPPDVLADIAPTVNYNRNWAIHGPAVCLPLWGWQPVTGGSWMVLVTVGTMLRDLAPDTATPTPHRRCCPRTPGAQTTRARPTDAMLDQLAQLIASLR
jgi:hypothetical protein